MDAITNGATIIVVQTGKVYHTLDTWRLAIENNNPIGDPVIETNYIQIPGCSELLDLSEVQTGEIVCTERPIELKLGGIRERMRWDRVISELRNLIDGQLIKLIMDNDPNYYYKGRAYIKDFDRVRELGHFTLSIPRANPYKYDITASDEDWLWDTFDFENGIIRELNNIVIDEENCEVTILGAGKKQGVYFTVLESNELVVEFNGREYKLSVGENYFPAIKVGKEDVILKFGGTGKLSINYRGAYL